MAILMATRLKIAVYSGTIPSTPFIERLIKGLAMEGMNVLLFGSIQGRPQVYSANIHVVGNRKGIFGVLATFGRIAKLKIGTPEKYKKLKGHLGSGPFSSSAQFRKWQKYVPVVLYLPDIFHVQWAKAAAEWLFLQTIFGVKMVLSLRGAHINYSPLADGKLREMYRAVLPRYDAYHAVSEAILAESIKYGVEKERARVIYSGLELPLFPKDEKHTNYSQTKLLVVGRMHWKKGYSHLLDCLRILKGKGVPTVATIIAGGDVSEEFIYHVHDAELGEVVELRGSLSHAEVIRQMVNYSALLLPSVEEGIANVVLEAMSAGLPVISTDCGGMREVISDGTNGFLVPVRDTEAMANAVVKMITLPREQLNQMRLNAYKTIVQKFNLATNIKDFVRLYSSIE